MTQSKPKIILPNKAFREGASMPYSDADERNNFVDLVAQTVIDKMEERSRLHELADLVVARVLALQHEQSDAQAEKAAHDARALSPALMNGNEEHHAVTR